MAISTIGASALDSGVSQLGKNFIDNGSMTVSQRGVNATIVTGFDSTTNSYIADRFLASGNGSPQNRADLKHVSSGGPTGFPNFIRYDVTTAETAVAAGESSIIQQRIEGFKLQSIQASSGIVALTLQFYMRSPKTGTHCVYLSTQNNRNIVKEFTVASADTWEKHTVSFIADTSGGTVSNAATEFLRVGWPIIAGTTFQGTADAWTASNIFATSNQQNLADNTANNIDITGVQLEVGSVATDFEHEDIAITRAKCERRLQRWTGSASSGNALTGRINSTTTAMFTVTFRQQFASTPAFSRSATVGDFKIDYVASAIDATVVVQGTGTSSNDFDIIAVTVGSASLTAGQAGSLRLQNDGLVSIR
jgi:mannose/fructose-specific phosphotransferase system component IIA